MPKDADDVVNATMLWKVKGCPGLFVVLLQRHDKTGAQGITRQPMSSKSSQAAVQQVRASHCEA